MLREDQEQVSPDHARRVHRGTRIVRDDMFSWLAFLFLVVAVLKARSHHIHERWELEARRQGITQRERSMRRSTKLDKRGQHPRWGLYCGTHLGCLLAERERRSLRIGHQSATSERSRSHR